MARAGQDGIASTVGLIYQAAYGDVDWTGAVEGIRTLFGGSRACVALLNERNSEVKSYDSAGDPEFSSAACVEAHARSSLLAPSLAVPAGVSFRKADVIDTDAFMRSELWADWYKPRDMHDWLNCNLPPADRTLPWVSIHRGLRQERFDRTDAGLLALLLPHLVKAIGIGNKISRASSLSEAISQLPFGVIVVDGDLNVIELDEMAARLASVPGPLAIRRGAVELSAHPDDVLLKSIVRAVCTRKDGIPASAGGTIATLPYASDQRSRIILSIAPYVASGLGGFWKRPAAVIFVREAFAGGTANLESNLRSTFQLTPAESRLASALASGLLLTEAAARSEVTVKTARTYLERIFAKTGTRRQSELVSLLNSLAAFTGTD